MTPERWSRIKELFGAALETPEPERPRFLESACGGDAELRAEVERLLAGNEASSWQSPAAQLVTAAAELAPGDTVAHYRIEARLGEGGMGVVYQARDTRLGRSVALKFVKAQFNSRSQREARAVAALNHPNICTLHDVGPNYLVMELIEGPTLAERVAKGAMPLGEALAIARQIAEALEAAHEKGIVHRDLKPANIKLTAEGTVKVLDFGLAKTQEAAGSPEDSPTITATMTGMILGTAGYMSPEQADGQPVDKRADIWSFGVVLWEMLTGHRLFAGETVVQTLAGVLRGPIEFGQLPRETPVAIRGLLRRCLDRNVKNRLRDIGEARIAIEAALAGETLPLEGAPVESRHARLLPWAAAAALCLVAGAGAGYFWPHRPLLETRAAQFTVDPPSGSTFADVFGASSMSPDGQLLVFSARDNGAKNAVLWLRPIDSLNAHALAGTEGGDFPFWSPDSQSQAFFADGKLKQIAVAGGTPVTLCEAKPTGPAGGAWNQDGVILFAGEDGLYRVPASGGVAARITQADAARHETAHGFPQFLPDGRRFLYYIQSPDPGVQGVYAGALDRPQERGRILSTDHKALYSPPRGNHPGLLLWLRDQTLLAQPFDAGKLKLEGEAARVAENISITTTSTEVTAPSRAAFWISDASVLVYHADEIAKRKLLVVGRDGKQIQEAAEEDAYTRIRLSPDGKRAIVGRSGASDRKDDLWLLDLGRGVMTRLTVDGKETGFAVWSPDGRSIAYSSERSGVVQIYRKDAAGGGQEEQLTDGLEPNYVTGWSRDGRYLFCTRVRGKAYDIWALAADEGGSGPAAKKPFLVVQNDGYAGSAAFSPDGKWMAYHSKESGRSEIYARPFAGAASVKTGKWQVSRQGGASPKWRADGRELFYTSPEGIVTAATVRTASGNFESDAPHELFRLPGGGDAAFDASADGQRFLVLALGAAGTANASPLTVVLNWQAWLK